MKIIELDKGFVTLVDDDDFDHLMQFTWWVTPRDHAIYVISNIDGKRVYMHRLILNAPKGITVDHRNGDALLNIKANLRLASQAENSSNRLKQGNNTSGFRGVTRSHYSDKWVAQIGHKRKKTNLGSYDTPEEASAVYEAKARELFGEFYREA